MSQTKGGWKGQEYFIIYKKEFQSFVLAYIISLTVK